MFSSWFCLFMPFYILTLLKFRNWQSVPHLASCFSANLMFAITCNSNHTGIYTGPGRIKLHVPGERSLGLKNTVRFVPTAVQSPHGQSQGTSITDKQRMDLRQCCALTEQVHFSCFFSPLQLSLLSINAVYYRTGIFLKHCSLQQLLTSHIRFICLFVRASVLYVRSRNMQPR